VRKKRGGREWFCKNISKLVFGVNPLNLDVAVFDVGAKIVVFQSYKVGVRMRARSTLRCYLRKWWNGRKWSQQST
jgi:hypothetical protein